MNKPLKKKTVVDVIIWSIAGILIVGLALAVVIPNFVKARVTSCANACVNNLRQIDAAAQQFALERGLTNGQPIHFPDDLTPYIKLNSAGSIPPCPKGGRYSISKIGETPTCTMSTLIPADALQ
jgi:type II secretory pathway pseudopilin PulG